MGRGKKRRTLKKMEKRSFLPRAGVVFQGYRKGHWEEGSDAQYGRRKSLCLLLGSSLWKMRRDGKKNSA